MARPLRIERGITVASWPSYFDQVISVELES